MIFSKTVYLPDNVLNQILYRFLKLNNKPFEVDI